MDRGPTLRRTRWCAARASPAAAALVALLAASPPALARRGDAPATPSLAAAGAAIAPGTPLLEALRRLRDAGLRVVFSTAVVTPELRVAAAPRGATAEAVLAELLAPHGLAAERGFRGRWLVVRKPAGEPRQGAAAGAERTLTESITVRALTEQLWDPATGARSLARATGPAISHSGSVVNHALALLPGTTGSDVLAPVHLRGAHADEVSLLLDGVEIRPAFRLAGLQGTVGLVDEAVVQKLEVLTGGYPAEYGGRVGGVLSLVSAAPAGGHGELGLGAFGARAYGEGRLGERTGWMLAARGGDLSAVFDTAGSAYERLEPEYRDVFAKLEREIAERGSLRGSFFHVADRLAFGLSDPEPPADSHPDVGHGPSPAVVPAAHSVDETDRQSFGWVTLDLALGERLASRTLLAHGVAAHEREGELVPIHYAGHEPLARSSTSRRDYRRSELRQDWTWLGDGRVSLRGGLRVASERLTQRSREAAGAVPGAVDLLRADERSWEAWASERVDLGRGRLLDLGVRWDRQGQADGAWSPRLNLAWPLGGGVARLAAGRVTQAPRLAEAELVRVAPAGAGDSEEGSTDEPPVATAVDVAGGWTQAADQLVLGYERRFGPVLLQLEAYRYEVRRPWPRELYLSGPLDVPSAGPAWSGGDRGSLPLVPASASTRGVELLARTRFLPSLDGLLSYSYAEAWDRVEGVDVPRGWDQRHSVDAYLAWRPSEAWTLDLGWYYHSGWPGTETRATVYVDAAGRVVLVGGLGPLNGTPNPAYHRLDLGIARTLALPRGSLEIEVGVINLYDRENVCCVDRYSTGVGPDLQATRQRFDLYWLPRTPTVAATWRF